MCVCVSRCLGVYSSGFDCEAFVSVFENMISGCEGRKLYEDSQNDEDDSMDCGDGRKIDDPILLPFLQKLRGQEMLPAGMKEWVVYFDDKDPSDMFDGWSKSYLTELGLSKEDQDVPYGSVYVNESTNVYVPRLTPIQDNWIEFRVMYAEQLLLDAIDKVKIYIKYDPQMGEMSKSSKRLLQVLLKRARPQTIAVLSSSCHESCRPDSGNLLITLASCGYVDDKKYEILCEGPPESFPADFFEGTEASHFERSITPEYQVELPVQLKQELHKILDWLLKRIGQRMRNYMEMAFKKNRFRKTNTELYNKVNLQINKIKGGRTFEAAKSADLIYNSLFDLNVYLNVTNTPYTFDKFHTFNLYLGYIGQFSKWQLDTTKYANFFEPLKELCLSQISVGNNLLKPAKKIFELEEGVYDLTGVICHENILYVINGMTTINNIKSGLFDNENCNFDTVFVLAKKNLTINEDLRIPGKNLVIFAPTWIIYNEHVIDLSGRNGGSDEEVESGQNGGDFFGFGLRFDRPDFLTFVTNGGDGANGRDATAVVSDDRFTKEDRQKCVIRKDKVKEILAEHGATRGGFGGAAGMVSLKILRNPVQNYTVIRKDGKDGKDGKLHDITFQCRNKEQATLPVHTLVEINDPVNYTPTMDETSILELFRKVIRKNSRRLSYDVLSFYKDIWTSPIIGETLDSTLNDFLNSSDYTESSKDFYDITSQILHTQIKQTCNMTETQKTLVDFALATIRMTAPAENALPSVIDITSYLKEVSDSVAQKDVDDEYFVKKDEKFRKIIEEANYYLKASLLPSLDRTIGETHEHLKDTADGYLVQGNLSESRKFQENLVSNSLLRYMTEILRHVQLSLEDFVSKEEYDPAVGASAGQSDEEKLEKKLYFYRYLRNNVTVNEMNAMIEFIRLLKKMVDEEALTNENTCQVCKGELGYLIKELKDSFRKTPEKCDECLNAIGGATRYHKKRSVRPNEGCADCDGDCMLCGWCDFCQDQCFTCMNCDDCPWCGHCSCQASNTCLEEYDCVVCPQCPGCNPDILRRVACNGTVDCSIAPYCPQCEGNDTCAICNNCHRCPQCPPCNDDKCTTCLFCDECPDCPQCGDKCKYCENCRECPDCPQCHPMTESDCDSCEDCRECPDCSKCDYSTLRSSCISCTDCSFCPYCPGCAINICDTCADCRQCPGCPMCYERDDECDDCPSCPKCAKGNFDEIDPDWFWANTKPPDDCRRAGHNQIRCSDNLDPRHLDMCDTCADCRQCPECPKCIRSDLRSSCISCTDCSFCPNCPGCAMNNCDTCADCRQCPGCPICYERGDECEDCSCDDCPWCPKCAKRNFDEIDPDWWRVHQQGGQNWGRAGNLKDGNEQGSDEDMFDLCKNCPCEECPFCPKCRTRRFDEMEAGLFWTRNNFEKVSKSARNLDTVGTEGLNKRHLDMCDSCADCRQCPECPKCIRSDLRSPCISCTDCSFCPYCPGCAINICDTCADCRQCPGCPMCYERDDECDDCPSCPKCAKGNFDEIDPDWFWANTKPPDDCRRAGHNQIRCSDNLDPRHLDMCDTCADCRQCPECPICYERDDECEDCSCDDCPWCPKCAKRNFDEIDPDWWWVHQQGGQYWGRAGNLKDGNGQGSDEDMFDLCKNCPCEECPFCPKCRTRRFDEMEAGLFWTRNNFEKVSKSARNLDTVSRKGLSKRHLDMCDTCADCRQCPECPKCNRSGLRSPCISCTDCSFCPYCPGCAINICDTCADCRQCPGCPMCYERGDECEDCSCDDCPSCPKCAKRNFDEIDGGLFWKRKNLQNVRNVNFPAQQFYKNIKVTPRIMGGNGNPRNSRQLYKQSSLYGEDANRNKYEGEQGASCDPNNGDECLDVPDSSARNCLDCIRRVEDYEREVDRLTSGNGNHCDVEAEKVCKDAVNFVKRIVTGVGNPSGNGNGTGYAPLLLKCSDCNDTLDFFTDKLTAEISRCGQESNYNYREVDSKCANNGGIVFHMKGCDPETFSRTFDEIRENFLKEFSQFVNADHEHSPELNHIQSNFGYLLTNIDMLLQEGIALSGATLNNVLHVTDALIKFKDLKMEYQKRMTELHDFSETDMYDLFSSELSMQNERLGMTSKWLNQLKKLLPWMKKVIQFLGANPKFQEVNERIREAIRLVSEIGPNVKLVERHRELRNYINRVKTIEKKERTTGVGQAILDLKTSFKNTFIKDVFHKAVTMAQNWVFPLTKSYLAIEKIQGKTYDAHLAAVSAEVQEYKKSIMLYTTLHAFDPAKNDVPFYKWNVRTRPTLLHDLFNGKPVILVSEILDGGKKNSLMAKDFEVRFVAGQRQGPGTQEEIDGALKGFWLNLTHSGISYFKFGSRIYRRLTETFTFRHTASTVEREKVESVVDYVLSPYTTWVLRLEPDSRGEYPVQIQDKIGSIELVGTGRYVINCADIPDVNQYFTPLKDYSRRNEK